MPLHTVQRLSPEMRDQLLEHYTIERSEQRNAERQELAARLAELNVGGAS